MSFYWNELKGRVEDGVNLAVHIIEELEKKYGMKIDDNYKAQLIGNLVLASSIGG